jgi:uncharacterized protein (DUF58 family)
MTATASAETAQQRLGDALSALAMLRSKRNRVFIISDLAGSLEIWRDWLHRLARKHEVHVLQITDPLDVQLPPAGMYNIRHGQEHVSFFAGDKKLRQRYAETYRARTQTIADICRHPALVHQSLSTEDTDWDALAWT